MKDDTRIAVIGSTGKLGAALAKRLANAGCNVVIGSRSAESARESAAEMGLGVSGGANVDAAAAADIVVVTVPFAAQESTLTEIAPHVVGKLWWIPPSRWCRRG